MQADTDEHTLGKLNQLIYLRQIVAPWLKAPVLFSDVVAAVQAQLLVGDVVDQEAARDTEAGRKMELIHNVAKNWQHTLAYLDGSNESGSGELVQRCPSYMRTGRYLVKLPVSRGGEASQGEIMLKFSVEDPEGGGEEDDAKNWIEVQPDALLEQTR